MAITRGPRASAARIASMVARCDSCVPCEKFSRKMSTPARISASSISGVLVAGPMVATILVWRMGSASLQSVSAMRQ